MKITFVNTLYAPQVGGGAELVLQEQAEALASAGHTVNVVTLTAGPDVLHDEINGVGVIRLPIRNVYFHYRPQNVSGLKKKIWHLRDIYNLSAARDLGRVLQQLAPDVAVYHNLAGFSVSALRVAKRLGIPVIQVLHDQYYLCPKSTMFKETRCASRCVECRVMRAPHARLSNDVDVVVAVSNFLLKKVLDYGCFGKVATRTVIHNAKTVVPQRRSREARDGVVFGFIGTLAPNKGAAVLIDAFVTAQHDRDCRLLVAGRGAPEYESHLRSLAAQNAKIEFSGYVAPDEFYSQVDVLVVPSLWEDTLPTVVMEALLHGIPVIGSNRGGIVEMITPGVNGALFDPDEAGALQRELERFANAADHWKSCTSEIVATASEFADKAAWLSKWETLFESTAKRAPSGNI